MSPAGVVLLRLSLSCEHSARFRISTSAQRADSSADKRARRAPRPADRSIRHRRTHLLNSAVAPVTTEQPSSGWRAQPDETDIAAFRILVRLFTTATRQAASQYVVGHNKGQDQSS
jgi:hypothetical protein